MATSNSDIVYVIDPDESVHDALRALLGSSGFRVACYPTAESFLDSAADEAAPGAVLIVEADLPGMGGLAMMKQAARLIAGAQIFALTSTSDPHIAEQARRAGAVQVLEKPLVKARLLDNLRSACRAAITT